MKHRKALFASIWIIVTGLILSVISIPVGIAGIIYHPGQLVETSEWWVYPPTWSVSGAWSEYTLQFWFCFGLFWIGVLLVWLGCFGLIWRERRR